MTTVTIPKKLTEKGDLVIISKNEYEAFLVWKGGIKEFKPTARDRGDLVRARRNRKMGRYITLEELEQELG